MDGHAIRTEEQVLQPMAATIRQREAHVFAVASRRGVAHLVATCYNYAVQDRMAWDPQPISSEDDVEDAVMQWRQDSFVNQDI